MDLGIDDCGLRTGFIRDANSQEFRISSIKSSLPSHHEPDELRKAKLEKDSSALFTTETRRARRCTENPDASVKSPCTPWWYVILYHTHSPYEARVFTKCE